MKRPEEIKKGLWHCEREKCKGCPYYDKCMMADTHVDLHADALEYIQQLENQIGELTEKVAQLEAAQSAAETFRRERDALLADLKEASKMDCSACKDYAPEDDWCEKMISFAGIAAGMTAPVGHAMRPPTGSGAGW